MHCGARTEPNHNTWRCFSHASGDTKNLLFGEKSDLCRPCRRLVLQFNIPPLHKPMGFLFCKGGFINVLSCLEKVFPILEISDKLFVPKPFREEHMGNSAGKSPIFSGFDRQPFMGFDSRRVEFGINNRDRAVIKHLTKSFNRCRNHPIATKRVASPDQGIFCIRQIIISITPIPGSKKRTEFFRFRTDGAVRDTVRRSKDFGEGSIDCISHVRIPSTHEHEFFWFPIFPQIHHFISDGIECFIPGNRDKFGIHALAFQRIGSLHWDLDPVRVIQLL